VTPVAFGTPSAIAVDPLAGTVWVCDDTDGSVAVYRPEAQSLSVFRSGLETPQAVAVDLRDGTGWVGDVGLGAVQHLTAAGVPAGPPVAPVDGPIGLALDPASGALWICERTGNRVRVVTAGGTGWATGMIAPSRVAVDSVTHEGWATSFTRANVVILGATGARLDSLSGFDGPVGIAVDSRRGRIWVCDPNVHQVLAYRRDRTLEFRVTGLAGAREVAVDEETGEAWVTLGLAGAVARLSPAGALIRTVGGMAEPYGVALDVPRRRALNAAPPASGSRSSAPAARE
jgi:DNA-binding beta-propeller fold protein YncE